VPISDIPIFSMLRTKMHWHQERQRLLAENVANADTPQIHAARSGAGRCKQAAARRADARAHEYRASHGNRRRFVAVRAGSISKRGPPVMP